MAFSSFLDPRIPYTDAPHKTVSSFLGHHTFSCPNNWYIFYSLVSGSLHICCNAFEVVLMSYPPQKTVGSQIQHHYNIFTFSKQSFNESIRFSQPFIASWITQIWLTAAKLTCPCNSLRTSNSFARCDTVVVIDSEPHLSCTCKTCFLFAPLTVCVHTACSALPFYTLTKLLIWLYFQCKTVYIPKLKIFLFIFQISIIKCKNKQKIQFLVCSWNHEYFGSLAKLTWSPTGFTYFARDQKFHDSMNIPKIEFIS